eukprot:5122784-Alexandrium_andersonii.AAC.2
MLACETFRVSVRACVGAVACVFCSRSSRVRVHGRSGISCRVAVSAFVSTLRSTRLALAWKLKPCPCGYGTRRSTW